MSSPISGSFTLAPSVGSSTGMKGELNLKIQFLKMKEDSILNELSLLAQSELKWGPDLDPLEQTDDLKKPLSRTDLNVKGIFSDDKTTFPALKSLQLEAKLLKKHVTARAGILDLGRDLTSNGFATLGLKSTGDWLRTPYVPYFERPSLHLFPGVNPGAFLEATGSPLDLPLTLRLYAGVSTGTKNDGIWTATFAGGKDPDTALLGTGGLFYTLGAGAAWKANGFTVGFDAGYSGRTYPETDSGFGKPGTPDGMLYGIAGVEVDRFTLVADYSALSTPDKNRSQKGMRALAAVQVYKPENPEGPRVSAFGAIAYNSLQGTKLDEEGRVVDDGAKEEGVETGFVDVTQPDGQLTQTKSIPRKEGTAGVLGAKLELHLITKTSTSTSKTEEQLKLTVSGGVAINSDTQLPSADVSGFGRLAIEGKF